MLARRPKGDTIDLATQMISGRFLFLNADNYQHGLGLKRPVLADYRPVVCVATSAANAGRFTFRGESTMARSGNCTVCGNYFKRLWIGKRCVPCDDEYRKRRYRESNRTQKLRKTLIPQRGNKCEGCGAKDKKLSLHHITPVSEGGATTPANLKVVCHDCHLAEHGGRFGGRT